MYDISHYERLKNRQIGSDIKIIPKIRLYINENSQTKGARNSNSRTGCSMRA